MLPQVVDALFTDSDRIDHDEVEIAASCGDRNVELVVNSAKVAETAVDTLQATLPLSVLQLSDDLVAAL